MGELARTEGTKNAFSKAIQQIRVTGSRQQLKILEINFRPSVKKRPHWFEEASLKESKLNSKNAESSMTNYFFEVKKWFVSITIL